MTAPFQDLTFALPNEGSTITASSEDGAHVAQNLLDSTPTKIWRTTSLPSPTLTVDLGAVAAPWDFIPLWGVNFSSTGTWLVEAAATEGGLGAPTFTQLVDGWPAGQDLAGFPAVLSYLWLNGATRSERWVRITFSEPTPVVTPGTVTPYLQAARLYITEGIRPLLGSSQRSTATREVGSTSVVTSAAHPSASVGQLVEDVAGVCDWLQNDEIATIKEIQSRGTSGDLMVFRDPNDTTVAQSESAYGVLDQQSLQGPASTGVNSNRWTWRVNDFGTTRRRPV